MEISADKIYLLILIPIIISAAVFVIKKYMKGNRYIYTGTVLRILTVTALILSPVSYTHLDVYKRQYLFIHSTLEQTP